MPPALFRLAIALSWVTIVPGKSPFELLGGGYCNGPTGSLVASLNQGGWAHSDISSCQSQCLQASSCDGFEFEDGEKKCRLLKGSIVKASGDHGPFQHIDCYHNSQKAAAAQAKKDAAEKAAKAKAETAKRHDTMDSLAPICNMFICPVGQKRAPRQGFAPWSYGCFHGDFEGMGDCCIAQDACLRTCGMGSRFCFNQFMQCTGKVCGTPSQDNVCQKHALDAIMEVGKQREDRCTHYEDAQLESCECKPEAEFRSSVEQWLEGFYAKHQPDKLNESKKLQNSAQIWNKWKNKETELLFALTKKYKGAVEPRNADATEVQYLEAQRKSAIADEDYMLAKRIKRREALVARKLEGDSLRKKEEPVQKADEETATENADSTSDQPEEAPSDNANAEL